MARSSVPPGGAEHIDQATTFLKLADKDVREGRFAAALEKIATARSRDPGNPYASAYEERVKSLLSSSSVQKPRSEESALPSVWGDQSPAPLRGALRVIEIQLPDSFASDEPEEQVSHEVKRKKNDAGGPPAADPKVSTILKRAKRYEREQDFERAFAELARASLREPGNAEILAAQERLQGHLEAHRLLIEEEQRQREEEEHRRRGEFLRAQSAPSRSTNGGLRPAERKNARILQPEVSDQKGDAGLLPEQQAWREAESVRVRREEKEKLQKEEAERRLAEAERERLEKEGKRLREEEERRRTEAERARLEEETKRLREEEERRLAEIKRMRLEQEAQSLRDEEARRQAELERVKRENEEKRRREEEALRQAQIARLRRELEEKRRREEEELRQEQRRKIEDCLAKARTHLAAHRFEEALTELSTGMMAEPSNADVLELIGQVRDAQKRARREESERSRRREEEERRPAQEILKSIRDHIDEADIFSAQQQFKEALRAISRAYALDPVNTEIQACERRILSAMEELRREHENVRRAREREEDLKREEEFRQLVEKQREHTLRELEGDSNGSKKKGRTRQWLRPYRSPGKES